MMFVKADTSKIVPGGSLMAEEALVDFGVRLAANRLVDHFEVHHIVARWGLVALGA